MHIYISSKDIFTLTKQRAFISNDMALSLHSLPVEMVYRILDNSDDKTLFLSARNACQRLNAIIDSYYRYQVRLDLLFFLKNIHFINTNPTFKYSTLLVLELDRVNRNIF